LQSKLKNSIKIEIQFAIIKTTIKFDLKKLYIKMTTNLYLPEFCKDTCNNSKAKKQYLNSITEEFDERDKLCYAFHYLEWVCYKGFSNLAKYFLQKITEWIHNCNNNIEDINYSSKELQNIFEMACINENTIVAKHIIKLNFNIDYSFVFACCYGYLTLAKYIISKTPNIVNFELKLSLISSYKNRNYKTERYILQHKPQEIFIHYINKKERYFTIYDKKKYYAKKMN
jgi:hypothetical protein